MASKSRPIKKTSKVKTVKETTILHEHVCTAECFKPLRRRTPPKLRRVSLGYIYMSSNGRFYRPWGDGEWLSVEGVDFLHRQDGALIRMFKPTEQLHIHSPGGRTIAKEVKHTEIKLGADYYAQQAAKKIGRKGSNLRDTQRFLASEAAKVIPRAPKKRKLLKGTGRGAPGQPRSPFSKQVVALRNAGNPEVNVVNDMMKWLKTRGEPATPLHRTAIKKRVHRWFRNIKKLTHN